MRWSASFARSLCAKDLKNAMAIRKRSRQKYETTATRVPMCNATSKERPNLSWSNPKKYCPNKRCPELDTGRNSVSPCTIPSTIACRSSSKDQALRSRGLGAHTITEASRLVIPLGSAASPPADQLLDVRCSRGCRFPRGRRASNPAEGLLLVRTASLSTPPTIKPRAGARGAGGSAPTGSLLGSAQLRQG